MMQALAEKLEPTEKERVTSVPQRNQLASTPELPLPKRNGTEHQIVRGKGVKVGENRTLARGGSEREHEEETVDFTAKEGRFQGGKGEPS